MSTSQGATQRQQIGNPEFRVHRLNEHGLNKADQIAAEFDRLLNGIRPLLPDGPETSRWNALVREHLEQACFYAKKSMSANTDNHL